MIKIYKKRSANKCMTSLANNKKIKKTSEVIELCGSLDELNSFLGFAAESFCETDTPEFTKLLKQIYRIQGELFEIGLQLTSGNKFIIDAQIIEQLELEIKEMSEDLPAIKAFILPGGGETSCRLHLARTICRRTERDSVRLYEINKDIELIPEYLNRLSDWIYIAARFISHKSNIEEVLWTHKK